MASFLLELLFEDKENRKEKSHLTLKDILFLFNARACLLTVQYDINKS
jgi:hypothetical protein